jgi:hypothetical protein
MDRSYQITPRDPVLGGGWNLALFDQGSRDSTFAIPVGVIRSERPCFFGAT